MLVVPSASFSPVSQSHFQPLLLSRCARTSVLRLLVLPKTSGRGWMDRNCSNVIFVTKKWILLCCAIPGIKPSQGSSHREVGRGVLSLSAVASEQLQEGNSRDWIDINCFGNILPWKHQISKNVIYNNLQRHGSVAFNITKAGFTHHLFIPWLLSF